MGNKNEGNLVSAPVGSTGGFNGNEVIPCTLLRSPQSIQTGNRARLIGGKVAVIFSKKGRSYLPEQCSGGQL